MDTSATTAKPLTRQFASRIPRDWLAAFLLALVVLLTRGFWFGDPVADFDEQIYSLIGWRMTHGDLPFVDVWDRKPFGLFAIFALAHWLFGPGPMAYQLVAALFAFGGSWLTYLLARQLVDRGTATVAGALYIMLISAYGSYSGQSEIFHTPLMLLMVWLISGWRKGGAVGRNALAMLVGGIALQVKYTVLPQCLFLGVWAIFCEWQAGARPLRLAGRSVLFAFLGILPTGLVAALYLATGHFDAFWFANFVSFFERVPNPAGRWQYELLAATLPLLFLALLGLYAAIRFCPPRDWRAYGLFVGWTLSAAASVFLPSTIYIYYYGALVPAVVLMGLPLYNFAAPGRFFPAVMLLAGATYILDLPDRIGSSFTERKVEARLSDAIRPHVGSKRDCLYVFDGPAVLYRTTGTCLPTRFVYPDHLNNGLERDSLDVDQHVELSRILATRPAVIVTADKAMTVQRAENLDAIRRATREDYRPLITVSLHHRQVTAWVRREGQS